MSNVTTRQVEWCVGSVREAMSVMVGVVAALGFAMIGPALSEISSTFKILSFNI